MLKNIKNNFPIFILIIIVVAGLGYPFYSGKRIMAPRLSEIDTQCYGVDVPERIKHNDVLHFCSCIHTAGIENKEEKYKYCMNQSSLENQASWHGNCSWSLIQQEQIKLCSTFWFVWSVGLLCSWALKFYQNKHNFVDSRHTFIYI